MDAPIRLSPALSRILRRHFDKDYRLYWADGAVRTYVNREETIQQFRLRYDKILRVALGRYRRDSARHRRVRANLRRWQASLKELVADLAALSHNDFDILSRIRPGEAMEREITKINGQPIELSKEE